MPFDGIVLAAVKKELLDTLCGLRIDKIFQPARDEVHLLVSRPGAKYRLLLSADPGAARVHLTGTSKPNPASPPVFCMVLRKHLEGGRIKDFSQSGYDRVLTISVDTRDELGRTSEKQLICEIMGKHSNIILFDPQKGIILDGIKRYSHVVSRHREVMPGRAYIPPPPQEKHNPLLLADEDFFKFMLHNDLTRKLSDVLQKSFDGLSPAMAREIVWRSGLETNTTLDTCGSIDFTSIYLVLRNIYGKSGKNEFEPAMAVEGKTPKDFAAFSLTHLKNCTHLTGGMNEIVDTYFTGRILSARLDQSRQSVLSLLRKEISRLEKKLAAQMSDLDTAQKSMHLKLAGELVTANIHRLNKGDTEVYLDNFYSPDGKQEKIILDPRLSPVENAQKFFRQYNKAKKSLAAASLHAAATREEIEYLSGVENAAELAATLEDINQIRAELGGQGYLKAPAPRSKNKKEADIPSPAAFLSSDGFVILAGKNNRQNDYLTMKIARPEDIWLHTKDIPGSHVIIRSEGKDVPNTTLEEAATLAALFSRARNSCKVPVDYTRRRFVSKPKGAKPGFVIYTDQKTVLMDPDPSLPEKLTQNPGQHATNK